MGQLSRYNVTLVEFTAIISFCLATSGAGNRDLIAVKSGASKLYYCNGQYFGGNPPDESASRNEHYRVTAHMRLQLSPRHYRNSLASYPEPNDSRLK